MFISLASSIAVSALSSIIIGQGDWRYEYDNSFLNLPPELNNSETDNMANAHGLCVAKNGEVFFTYQPKKLTETTQVVVKFTWNKEKNYYDHTYIGPKGPSEVTGIPHGLKCEYDEVEQKQYLYLVTTHQGESFTKLDTDGNVIWRGEIAGHQTANTNSIVLPGTDIVLATDGYGTSVVYEYSKKTGKFTGKTFGKGIFACPHGISFDPKADLIIVADRSHHRRVWLNRSYDVVYISNTNATGMGYPDTTTYWNDTKAGQVSIVPSLGDSVGPSSYRHGAVAIYDENVPGETKLLSLLSIADTPLGKQGSQNPHDVVFLPNGDVLIACWAQNKGAYGAKGTLTYWKRLQN